VNERGLARPLAAVLACLVVAGPRPGLHAAPAQPGLTGIAQLRPIYDLILDARLDQAERQLTNACDSAPAAACKVLQATVSWWRILLDPNDTSHDAEFTTRVDDAIDSATRWSEREPERAEAWFYLGCAYGARVSFRVQRGERLAAARDGKHIKEALERASSLDPQLDDARFGVGLYKYYADIAPTAAKVLRFLLMLPGGDRVEGLKDMEAVHERGVLLRGEADYQLHWIYLWYENEPKRAYALLKGLRQQYPGNPHFVQRMADVDDRYFHDAAAALADWQGMVDTAAKMGDPVLAEVEGRLGAAAALDELAETDRALAQVERLLSTPPGRPYGARAQAEYLRGRFFDRLGRREQAVTAYRAALAALPAGDLDHIGEKARSGLRTTADPKAGDAYRTSLVGWRAFEQHSLQAAEASLAQAEALAPTDALIRVRHARVRQALNDSDKALATYDQVIGTQASASPLAVSAAYLWSGALLEARGNVEAARARYRSATHVFAGDSRLGAEASRALERLAHR
jgi:tetratricopeptide (TPR) repeat protein